MTRIRGCAAFALWLSIASLISACSGEVAVVVPPEPVPAAPRPPPIEPVTPNQVRTVIADWFRAAGYQEFQVGALLAHARTESGFRPCARGAADLSYTYQWGGTRLERLHGFAGTRNCPPLEKQLAFADNELRGNPKFGCFWEASTGISALRALQRGFGRGQC